MDTGNKFAGLAIGVLIMVTAFGNAKVMFFVSILGLIIGMALLPKTNNGSSVLAVTIGFFLTMVVAILVWISK